ncbi:MAG TPA: zf-HC2 domain-containing protein [Myxococcota bacterium]|nr:zf-HC2 domain-containing protein [Myxococcota bacterium]
MRACEDFVTDLELFHDGELAPPAVHQLEHHLRQCASCRAELETLSELRRQLVQHDSATPHPDLWGAIEARLPALDSELHTPLPWWRRLELGPWILRPIGVVAAFGAIAAVVVLARPPAPIDVVRSIDTSGRPVMVLPSSDDATIIWVMDDPSEDSGTGETPSGL